MGSPRRIQAKPGAQIVTLLLYRLWTCMSHSPSGIEISLSQGDRHKLVQVLASMLEVGQHLCTDVAFSRHKMALAHVWRTRLKDILGRGPGTITV
ncbi:predicted protein [Histoplasma mississippiense (nom. inval.)]|uniref:predicted protein n=1 Tax=Ajellomyces capsulatus (strain NAm1 / WU24) TaxID=2059318 RepID=UPI000157C058|nr:predicted protein [Histoplasma mississippiense (nom. inval.)]EDN06628.1 predicted protein [Histoplasma mississippiense (nom. inval.)]